jgi:hypothetical protein
MFRITKSLGIEFDVNGPVLYKIIFTKVRNLAPAKHRMVSPVGIYVEIKTKNPYGNFKDENAEEDRDENE